MVVVGAGGELVSGCEEVSEMERSRSVFEKDVPLRVDVGENVMSVDSVDVLVWLSTSGASSRSVFSGVFGYWEGAAIDCCCGVGSEEIGLSSRTNVGSVTLVTSSVDFGTSSSASIISAVSFSPAVV